MRASARRCERSSISERPRARHCCDSRISDVEARRSRGKSPFRKARRRRKFNVASTRKRSSRVAGKKSANAIRVFTFAYGVLMYSRVRKYVCMLARYARERARCICSASGRALRMSFACHVTTKDPNIYGRSIFAKRRYIFRMIDSSAHSVVNRFAFNVFR